MTDSVAILSPTDRVTDANVDAVSWAKINFYEAETTTPRVVYADKDLSVPLGSTVYCDSGGFPVTADGGTTKTSVFTGIGAYKLIVTDADDVTLITLDNLPGAIDTSDFSGGGQVQQQVPVVAKSASFTVDEATDNGILFDITCTGGDAVVTLPSAIDAEDGFYIGLRHNGTANEVIIETVSSQTIRHFGAATDALPLTGRGETVRLVSDGANWVVDTYVPALINNAPGIITIADRLSAPPVSPGAGARYLLTSSPSGAWSSFSEHDIVESDGSGSWIRRTPPTDSGWLVYVQDEDQTYQRRGSTWVSLAASDTVAGDIEIATSAEMESASSTALAVTPGRARYHPGVAKAWGKVDFAGAIQASYGVGSIADTGAGTVTVTWFETFSSANYALVVSPLISADRYALVTSQAAGSAVIASVDGSSGSPADATNLLFAAFGDI